MTLGVTAEVAGCSGLLLFGSCAFATVKSRAAIKESPKGDLRCFPLVGYESASQFNREYSRLFGQPPIRDIRTLRSPSAPSLELPTKA